MKPVNGVLTDESVHLFQRALYVEPVTYKVDPDKIPVNGYEYIYKVRQEEESLFPGQRQFYESIPAFEIKVSMVDGDEDKVEMPNLFEWKNKEAIFFSRLANQLKVRKGELMRKFPRRKFPSVTNVEKICLFCLGSDLYQKIYVSDDEVDEAISHSPLLSIVLHISQEDIFILLQHMTVWAMQTNFDHTVCRWIYALLACLQKPISDECEEFLENFYDYCVCRSKDCDENEKNQVFLLSSILENYFCVKAYAVGPSLDRFMSLC